ncbi:unnamed protein product [Protopolystoma xenopodis]|uniref:Uncharacterized protein n=1 Tax=Protopolystoma xenopodis TaxID=117903 RepID=A0A3S5CI14_9PLAT|nr:unnamed protein product [Protopolystoma xenopodis]
MAIESCEKIGMAEMLLTVVIGFVHETLEQQSPVATELRLVMGTRHSRQTGQAVSFPFGAEEAGDLEDERGQNEHQTSRHENDKRHPTPSTGSFAHRRLEPFLRCRQHCASTSQLSAPRRRVVAHF